MLNFPNAPIEGQQYSAGTKTWQWNGYAWDLTSISEAQVKRAEDAAALAMEAAGLIGTDYLSRSEVVSPTVIYRADAPPGSTDLDPLWRIRKITIIYGSTTQIVITYPDGDKGYSHQWYARATYNYS